MGDGAGCGWSQLAAWRLEVGSERWEELTVVPGSIHINSPVRFSFSCFHISCFMFHISKIYQASTV
jgi:hypothetical protein